MKTILLAFRRKWLKQIVEIISEMKKNSDCWSIYNMLGDTERKEELHQKNIVLAKNITKISSRKVIMDRWGSWHWDHESGPILY